MLQIMEKIWEWKHHKVYLREDDWIMKIPKWRSCIFWKQATLSQDFFNRHFHAYIPETFIEKGSKGVPYYVFQKRVSGVTLSEYLQVATFSPEILTSPQNFPK
jgi:hypothetical protein